MHNAVRDFVALFQPDLMPTGLSAPSTTDAERAFLLEEGKAVFAMSLRLRELSSTATGLGARLMLEELGETLVAASRGDTEAFADGLADLLYVVLWNAVAHGVPIEAVFAEVHRANMTKAPVCPKCNGSGRETITLSAAASFFNGHDDEADVACDGCAGKGRVVTRDAGGKVVKPAGWTPPDIAGVLRRHEMQAAAGAAMDEVHLRILAAMPGPDGAKRARMTAAVERYRAAYGAGDDPHKRVAAHAYAATPERAAEAVFGEWWRPDAPSTLLVELVDKEDGAAFPLAGLLNFYLGVDPASSSAPVHLAEYNWGHPDRVSFLYPGGYVAHIGDPVIRIVKLHEVPR